jgi:hypothetical protein
MRPLGPRSTWLTVLLATQIVLLIAGILGTLSEIELLERVQSGGFVTPQEATSSDERVAAIGWLSVVAFVATVVVWCMWQHRAHANVHAADRRMLTFTPGWSVGWWFIPFANIWKPFQAVREIWKASDPSADDIAWERKPTWVVLGFWWAMWLLGNALSGATLGLDDDATVSGLIAADRMLIASDVASIVAAALAIAVVRAINARQAALARVASVPRRVDLDAGAPPLPEAPGPAPV